MRSGRAKIRTNFSAQLPQQSPNRSLIDSAMVRKRRVFATRWEILKLLVREYWRMKRTPLATDTRTLVL